MTLDELIAAYGGRDDFYKYILVCAEEGERIRQSMTPEEWEAHLIEIGVTKPKPLRKIVL